MVSVLHNPHSELSRRAVGLLSTSGSSNVQVVDVVGTAPDAVDAATLLAGSPVGVRDLLDRQAPLYFLLGLDEPEWSDAEILTAAMDNPTLLRCPIVIDHDRIWLGDEAVSRLATTSSADVDQEQPPQPPLPAY